ncbi:SbcD-like subunit of palindrome specific endonuclease [Rhizobium phage RHph_TM30]|uniref:Recombination endonuclease protein n=1 Tax=Rhizobium phage RHph_TM30 TaxID=2509764 RepID=A0A7S5R5H2_9CAUD|nr:SbcD-like subunit of palindrome specific endonuclease [Rhizobium phage RHph_TM30]QIG71347.1 recombination endonuclease protein [Rhizobium phage RHph_TM30]QIG72074.1 recombination endonuclease protein [Rhizobium phage RHph_TM2_3B]QIG72436.1 recombination endonuclease protein [Rhizobium phage RHph_TM3_3_6]
MKVLITGDIHLHDFRVHNLFGNPYFRLGQYSKLADRLVQIIKEHNVGAMAIAGDFLHVASPRPYITNAAGKFLDKIAAHVPLYVTHGQHDYDSRTEMSSDNTLLSMYNGRPNIRYLHKESVTLDGRKFYFQGWTSQQDFSHIKHGEYDVLIGHATIQDSIINQYGTTMEHGQSIENDKFKICFFGDIHRHQVKGNQVIPGVPIQANFGDHPDVGVIILDTETLEWTRVKTITEEFPFLRFLVTDKVFDDPYIVTKLPASNSNATKREKLHKSIDIMEVIDKSVLGADVLDIHDLALAAISKLESDEVNLNFSIISLKIRNFRSIDKVEWTPKDGVMLINGINGAGKSTLIRAISFALHGSRSGKSLVRKEQTEMSVDLELTYNGINYRIYRGLSDGKGWLNYFIDSKQIETENQTATNDRISKDLKFLSMWQLLYHVQGKPRFLSAFNYGSRVELVSNVVGLSIVERLKQAAESIKSKSDKEYSSLSTETDGINMYLETMKSVDFSEMQNDYSDLIGWADRIIKDLNDLINLERDLASAQSEMRSSENALSQYKDIDFSRASMDTEQMTARITSLSDTINSKNKSISEYEREISEIRNKMGLKQQEIQSKKVDISSIETKMHSLQASTCYACDQIVGEDKVFQMKGQFESSKMNIEEVIKSLQTEIPDLLQAATKYMADIETVRKDVNVYVEEKSSLSTDLSNITNLRNQYARFNNVKAVLNKNIDDVAALNSKVDLQKIRIKERFGTIISHENTSNDVLMKTREQLAILKEKQSNVQRLTDLHKDMTAKIERLSAVKVLMEEIVASRSKYDKYISLMDPKGIVTRSVLTAISEQLSNDKIKVVAHKTLANGETRPDFNLLLNVHGKWIEYDELSGGQMIVCDLYILSHLISICGGAGLLIFDETFGELDPTNLEYTVDMIKSINVQNILIVSHHEAFPYYDHHTVARLQDGVTNYTFS